jgi:hypothetical protein
MNTTATSAPSGLFNIQLSPEELANPDVRRRIARNNYSAWGFPTVAESQEFIDSVAALADGEPVSAAFKARSEAEAADRRRAAEAAVQATKAWGAQQQFNAAMGKLTKADKRLRTARANLDFFRESSGAMQAPDFGQPVEYVDGAGWSAHVQRVEYVIAYIEKVTIPQLTVELVEAQKAVDALQQAPKATTAATAKATGRS